MVMQAPETVDIAHCRHLIAKAIMFKEIDKVINEQDFGGYKINIVAYTMARIVHDVDQRLDLDHVWRDQATTPTLRRAAAELSRLVRETIISPLRGTHVGEWTKKQECWDAVQSAIPWTVPQELHVELTAVPADSLIDTGRVDAYGDVATVSAIAAEDWFNVARWAKATDNLKGWQRQIAFTIGRYLSNGWPVTDRQAVQGVKLMEEARSLGFRPGQQF